jgi:hypothetical protein
MRPRVRAVFPLASFLAVLLATSAAVSASTGSVPGASSVALLSAGPAPHAVNRMPAPVTGTAGTVPPSNPPQSIPPSPNFLNSCSGSSYDNSAACTNAALAAIDNARAYEGLSGMGLPSDWYSLSATQQLFVATNLERQDRGLPVLSAMATALDQAATQGAAQSQDPEPPGGFPWSSWGSNWAGAVGNPLEAMYYWMYDDGLGSNNVDCTPSNTSGCWGHRDNVLMPLACAPCVIGTGYVGNGYQGYPSWAELLVDSSGNPQIDYTWAQLLGGPTASGPGPSPESAPSIAVGPTGLPTEAVLGPGNAVWIYWEAANAQWYGPLGVGGGFGAPSISIGPSGLPTVAVQGPGNSVWIYWEAANAQWYGPLGVGQGSSPSIADSPSTGLPTVAVQGPGNGVWIYWEAANAQWYGPLGVGQGSSPSIASGPSGLPTVAVQGPGNGVWVYWEAANAQWYGPLGVGGGVGAPRIADSPSSGLPTVAVQGPGDALWVYWEAANAQWYGPLGIGAGGSTLAPPSIAVGPSGLPTVGVLAPGASWVYWEAANAQWYGPLSS